MSELTTGSTLARDITHLDPKIHYKPKLFHQIKSNERKRQYKTARDISAETFDCNPDHLTFRGIAANITGKPIAFNPFKYKLKRFNDLHLQSPIRPIEEIINGIPTETGYYYTETHANARMSFYGIVAANLLKDHANIITYPAILVYNTGMDTTSSDVIRLYFKNPQNSEDITKPRVSLCHLVPATALAGILITDCPSMDFVYDW